MRRFLFFWAWLAKRFLLFCLLIYFSLGLIVIFSLLTPPSLFIGHKYIGLLPYRFIQSSVQGQTDEEPLSIVFEYGDRKKAFDTGQLEIKRLTWPAVVTFKNGFNRQNLFQRWRFYSLSFFRPVYLKPMIEFDSLAVSQKLASAFTGSWPQPRPAKLSFINNKVQVISAVKGYQIDSSVLTQAIQIYLYSQAKKPIAIPLQEVSLKPSPSRLNQALAKAANLIKRKIILKNRDLSLVLTNQEKVSLVSFYQDINSKVLIDIVKDKARIFNRPPQNATFQFKNGRVVVFKQSADGFKLNADQLKEDLIAAFISAGQADSDQPITIQAKGRQIKPKITTADANSYGIKELVGQGRSWFYHSTLGRIYNIKLAASRISGVLVPPGSVFSFNKTLGQVTAATGYRQSYVIKDGKTILDDGGGVCQVSTTLFRAILKAGLPILERHYHSYRVGYYEQKSPPGFDATVFSPYVDLKFKNDLQSYILIQAKTDIAKRQLTFSLYGTKDSRQVKISQVRIWDQAPPPPPVYQDDPNIPEGKIKQVEWPAWGAKVAFDWTVTKNGQVLHQKTFYSVYKPWAAVFLK